MKTAIRRCSFETNSSSTHSMVVMSPAEYERLSKSRNAFAVHDRIGELKPGTFVTWEEAAAALSQEDFSDDIPEWAEMDDGERIGYACDEWMIESCLDNENYETEMNRVTTPGGEEIVVLCQYGFDC